MVEPAQLLTIFDHIIRWIGAAKENVRRNDSAYQEALTKIFKAANDTQNYLANRATQGQSREKEEDLSWLWTEAGLALRKFDHDLADRCLLKGHYWTSPDNWTDEQVQSANIKLERVFNEARALI